MQQRSAEWFRARCGRITGSRFAHAMARRDSQSYRQLIDDLVRERLSGKAKPGGYVSPAMQWGIDHESSARSWYARSKGRTVREIGFVVHPQHDFVGVSPDGLIDHDGLVEIKCPQLHNFNRIAGDGAMPSRYRWQVQGQLWVCSRVWLDFVCFYPPGRGAIVSVAFDGRDADRLENRCTEINSEVELRLRAHASRSVKSSPSVRPRYVEGYVATSPSPVMPNREVPSEKGRLAGWALFLIVVLVIRLINWILR